MGKLILRLISAEDSTLTTPRTVDYEFDMRLDSFALVGDSRGQELSLDAPYNF